MRPNLNRPACFGHLAAAIGAETRPVAGQLRLASASVKHGPKLTAFARPANVGGDKLTSRHLLTSLLALHASPKPRKRARGELRSAEMWGRSIAE